MIAVLSRPRRTLLAALLLPATASCAFTNIPVTLPTAGLGVDVTGGAGRRIVVISPFVDHRKQPERCGRQKNGYGMDTADAVCQGDPLEWIAERLTTELRLAGFEVSTSGDEQAPEIMRVEGSLLQLFVEPIMGAWTGSLEADISVRLHATTSGGLSAQRTFYVKGWKGGVLASTATPYNTSLYRATGTLLDEMVRAIIDLADRYPQLGNWKPATVTLACRALEGTR